MRSTGVLLLVAATVPAAVANNGTATATETVCEDLTLASGQPWHDVDGPNFNCEWYASGTNCQQFGNQFRNELVANEACCVCGGGTTRAPTPIPTAAPPPTPAPPVPSPAPGACPPRVRKAYSTLPCAERMLYANAVRELKRRYGDDYNDIVSAHLEAGQYAHGTSAFLPWHRWYLVGYENALRALGGEFACITIPYWDWEVDAGDELNSAVLAAATFGSSNGLSGGCVSEGIAAAAGGWVDRQGSCLRRTFSRLSFTGEAQLADIITSNPDYEDFRVVLEGSPHATPHVMIGGQMGTFSSPEDPLFFMHHANVDRIWALWQNYHGYHTVPKAETNSTHYFPAAESGAPFNTVTLDGVMPFRTQAGDPLWHFQEEVRVRDMMHIDEGMPRDSGYTYGPDRLADLLNTARGSTGEPITWDWAEPATLDPVQCPEHDSSSQGRGAAALNGRRGAEIVERVRKVVKRLRDEDESMPADEVFDVAARYECGLVVRGDEEVIPDAWLRMMGKPPARFRKYFQPCTV